MSWRVVSFRTRREFRRLARLRDWPCRDAFPGAWRDRLVQWNSRPPESLHAYATYDLFRMRDSAALSHAENRLVADGAERQALGRTLCEVAGEFFGDIGHAEDRCGSGESPRAGAKSRRRHRRDHSRPRLTPPGPRESHVPWPHSFKNTLSARGIRWAGARPGHIERMKDTHLFQSFPACRSRRCGATTF